MTTLTADKVHETFIKCLFKEGEPIDNPAIAEGLQMKVGFHPGRLKEKEPLILQMLSDLPEEFQQDGGGGMSFLNACNDREGEQWADTHRTIEELLCLGIATNHAKILMPRDMWNLFPGGLPYFVVLSKEQEPERSVVTGML